MILALLPVKQLGQAKQRLAGLLSPPERRALCIAMLTDVLSALSNAKRLDDVVVFSSDEAALAMARQWRFCAVTDHEGPGQSAAVTGALPHCLRRGATAIVTVPLDVPLLQGADIDALVAHAEAMALPAPAALMVPSADGTGTNALYLTPPDALPPRFGPNSFARHRSEAERLGVAHRALTMPRLGLDIDTPEDLAAFLKAAENSAGRFTVTYQYLRDAGLADRCVTEIARVS